MYPRSPIGPLVSQVEKWNPRRSASDEPFTYIDLSSVDRDGKQIVEPAQTLPAEAPSRARQLVRSGDVLVSTVRPNLNGVAAVPDALSGATASTGFTVLRPKPGKLDTRYLFYWVQTPAFVDDMTCKSTGASYPAVSDAIVKASAIPLPRIKEQRRIADILDRADAIRRKRRAAIALTEELLRSTFRDMFGDPVTNPKGWPVRTAKELFSLKSGKFLPAKRMNGGDIPVYGGNGIAGYHDVALFAESRVLIGRVGMHCGAVHRTGGPSWVTDNALYIAEKDSSLTDDYLEWVLRMIELNQYASRSAQPLLSGSRIYPIALPVPPLARQQGYSRWLAHHGTLVERLEVAADEADTLFHALTQRAFRGEL